MSIPTAIRQLLELSFAQRVVHNHFVLGILNGVDYDTAIVGLAGFLFPEDFDPSTLSTKQLAKIANESEE